MRDKQQQQQQATATAAAAAAAAARKQQQQQQQAAATSSSNSSSSNSNSRRRRHRYRRLVFLPQIGDACYPVEREREAEAPKPLDKNLPSIIYLDVKWQCVARSQTNSPKYMCCDLSICAFSLKMDDHPQSRLLPTSS